MAEKVPLTRQSISSEFATRAGLDESLTAPSDRAGEVEEIDESISPPANIIKIDEKIVTANDGSKTAEITLSWDDSGDNFEYEIQIGDIES